VDCENGVIFGVCVMVKGEAKGHNLLLDDKSIDGFLSLCQSRKDGVKVRFGKDHEAGADDINGSLKNFRREENKIRADLHLLKSDKNFSKIIEMAEMLPNEFGLSASTTATEELIGRDRYVRFTEVQSVDIVSNPAATSGLFFSANNNQPKNTMNKEFALVLGLPETATESEIKLALEAKCKMESEAKAEAEAKKKLEAEEEEKEGKGEKKFSADLEAIKLELATLKANDASKLAAAHKNEVEAIKLEAGKDGKVIPISDEAILKLSVVEVREMVSKLPKGQLKLSKGTLPTGKDNKPLDKRSLEFRQYLSQKREEGALALGQKMTQN
jgi:hypothetical protein